jgi:dihydrofolate synthase/folylpolyglutamate synthase
MNRLSCKGAVGFLYGLERSGIKLGLDRTVNLLEAVGNPHRRFTSIHVAGTNGKGSVACYLNSVLFHSGLRTGLFTSPHLVDYRERIRVDGHAIPCRDLADLVAELKVPILETGASYFEATTVLAFEYFARRNIDVGVIEVGMGGRLDSTNVLSPALACITSIDFDHVEYLGRTLSKIAGEKAGIIKPQVPVVCGRLSPKASAAIRKAAASQGSRMFEMGRDASFTPLAMDLRGSRFEYSGAGGRKTFEIGSPGFHHVANAATALLALEVLADKGFKVKEEAVRRGLRLANWPGRLHPLRRRPLVLCDAAHNVSGVKLLVKSLETLDLTKNVTVFGVLRDKDCHGMLALLARCSESFVLTKPDSDRALPIADLKAVADRLGLRFKAAASVQRAVEIARMQCGARKSMLVCGSIYALGEAMKAFDYRPYTVSVC